MSIKFNKIILLKSAKSLRDLAVIIGVKPSSLSYILYVKGAERLYSQFSVPKKGGGRRRISAPSPQLAQVQRNLTTILSQYVNEMNDAGVDLVGAASFAFRSGRSIFQNAESHRNARYVVNLDISNFFGSINFGRVRGYFMSNKHWMLNDNIATIIAQICCYKNALPQGAPSSPIISNLIARNLDSALIYKLKGSDAIMTRYADDITISTRKKQLPKSIARKSSLFNNKWYVGNGIREALRENGFKLNKAKFRVQVNGSRKDVTGLSISDHAYVDQNYYRKCRAAVASLSATGKFFIESGGEELLWENETDLQRIEGRLNFVRYGRSRDWKSQNYGDRERAERLRGVNKLFKKFLFFKYFVSLQEPIILTEGKTDVVYLSCALESLPKKYPSIYDGKNRKFRWLFPRGHVREILNIHSGYGGLKQLVENYHSICNSYSFCPLMHPVIILVDNDDGGNKAAVEAERIKKPKPPKNWTKVHVVDNLYIVRTPLLGGATKSCIEDLFAESVLKQELGGKVFELHPSKAERKKKGTYSKEYFAKGVVIPNKSAIDFTGFEPILNDISWCLSDYARRRKSRKAPAP